jgi:hypothetical protein
MGPGGGAVCFAAAHQCVDQVHRAVEGEQLRCRGLVLGRGAEDVERGGDDVLGLVEAPQPDEGVGEAEVAGDDVEGVAGELGGGDRSVGGDPGGVGLVLAGEGDGDSLVGAGAHDVEPAAFVVPIRGAHCIFEQRDHLG